MSLGNLALMLYLVIDGEHSSGGMAVWPVLGAMWALQLGVMLILWRIFGSGGHDGDDPGSGGDGPGWRRRRRPRKPPPDGPVCWPEFERQFAEHVASAQRVPAGQGDRDEVGASARAHSCAEA